MWSGLKACPAYFGGKQKLADRIINFAQTKLDNPKIFVDAFLGGGSVALTAKSKGMQVFSNDMATRSELVGKAVIENNKEKITMEDFYMLTKSNPNKENFVMENFNTYFPSKVAKFIDNCFSNLVEIEDKVKFNLLKLLIVKYTLQCMPFQIMYKMTKNYKGTYWTKVIDFMNNPLNKLRLMMKQINGGIINNGYQNYFFKMDVIEFLEHLKGITRPDVVYFDPPYYGARPYEYYYLWIDSIIEQKMLGLEKSKFNKGDWKDLMTKMFEASEQIPLWIISFGGPKVKPEELNEIVSQFRKTQINKFPYHYSMSAKHFKVINEYLVIAGNWHG